MTLIVTLGKLGHSWEVPSFGLFTGAGLALRAHGFPSKGYVLGDRSPNKTVGVYIWVPLLCETTTYLLRGPRQKSIATLTFGEFRRHERRIVGISCGDVTGSKP